MKTLGFTCGIGSMLYGAQNAGYDVIGNIEWRTYYHTGTFERNFPNVPFGRNINQFTTKELEAFKDVDLLFGHTECGNYSNLSNTGTNKKLHDIRKNSGDIPEYIAAVKYFKPKYFAMDNLPGSLQAVPIERYRYELPEYNIEAHLISNYHYGNIQLHRFRLFIIGWRKDVPFKFICGEFDHRTTTRDIIGDLGEIDQPEINHIIIRDNEYLADGIICLYSGDNLPVRDIKRVLADLGEGKTWEYTNAQGLKKMKAGYVMTYENRFCHTLTGKNCIFHYTGRPLTIRERARIQGFKDDFIFVHGRSNPNGMQMVKQTGKCMPIQWCEYLSGLIRCYVEPDSFMKPSDWPEYFFNKSLAKDKVFKGVPAKDINYYESQTRCELKEEE